jgi:sugar O-acyltransferase (sialic acid O-acetyltransferase NeuD family)
MKNIIIVGAGGLGREVLDLLQIVAEKNKSYKVLGFADDALPQGFLINGYEILGNLSQCVNLPNVCFVIAIGNPSIRLIVFEQLKLQQQVLCNIIHPTAQLSSYAVVEPDAGVILFGNSFIGPNAKIGANVLIHQNAIVGHDAIIGNHSIILQSCVLNGQITLESAVMVGPLTVMNGKHFIRKSGVIGAGSNLS